MGKGAVYHGKWQDHGLKGLKRVMSTRRHGEKSLEEDLHLSRG